MPNLNELAKLMKELEDLLAECSRCGICQSVCPLFQVTGHETDVARGKLALLDGLAQGMFEKPAYTKSLVSRCLLCGSCQERCPRGVSSLEIFLKARVILTGYMGLSGSKKLLLRKMLANPATFDSIMEKAAKYQGLVSKPLEGASKTSCARIFPQIIKNRHFVPLAETPFHKTLPSLDTGHGILGIKAAFFPGCLLDKIYPGVAEKSVKSLKRTGAGVYLPEGLACCGMPAIASGDIVSFVNMVKHNLKLLDTQKFDFLVTSCATCTFAIKKVWPMMAAGDDERLSRKVNALAEKTMDICQFLVRFSDPAPAVPQEDALRITYHDPCHLRKSLGIFKEPRAIIMADPAFRLVEMEEPEACCGMGGSFNVEHYDISSLIGNKKGKSIIATGADIAATACPACMMQLSDILSGSGNKIAVKHVVELF